jgi:SsrA-binding protein
MKEKEKKADKQIATHHEARHYYEILESLEVGLVLVGCEVKSLREGQCSLAGTFARFEGKDLIVQNLYIAPYPQGNRENPDPKRIRKLLLHKSQLEKIRARVQEKGLTLIPLKMYFNDRSIAKMELGVGRSKKLHDQRSDIKKKDVERQIDRAIKSRNRK